MLISTEAVSKNFEVIDRELLFPTCSVEQPV